MAIDLQALPILLDPGWLAHARQPLPAATGTKVQPPQRYFRGERTGKLYFRDSDGTFYELRDPERILGQWPEALAIDGEKQMDVTAPYADAPKRSADRHKRYRERRRAERRSAKLGPADFAQAEAEAAALVD